jgi:TonB-linked SusC/RagA family outer membrane protein
MMAICLICPTKGNSQKISLSLKNASLEKAFKLIEQQTSYKFVYTNEAVALSKPVSFEIKNETLDNVLKLCFSNQPLDYSFDDKLIIVKVSEKKTETVPARFIVHGIVTNENGEPLNGATIKIKESSFGTIADDKGEFTFENVDNNFNLIISNIGYQTAEIPILKRTNISVALKAAINNLNETLVIAYGKTTKRLNTGSVSKISAADIDKQPITNPLSAIQGRAPGVYVNTQNGLPGGNILIQIRGKGSINAGTEPLYVVDGVPFNSTPLNSSFSTLSNGVGGAISPLNSINPADIESIEILKDADATAIYGSRAANGVVLITTKKGSAGKTKFDVDLYTGFSRLADFPRLLNTKEYLELRHEGFQNDGITPTTSNAPDLLIWDSTQSINWSKYMLGETAVSSNGQISFSGGNQNTNFYISGNYRNEGSVLRGNEKYERGGAYILLHHNAANKKFSFDFSSTYSADNNQLLSSSLFTVFTLPPNTPVYDSNGKYNWVGISTDNPGAVLERRSISKTNNIIANTSIVYSIIHDLIFKTNVGYTRTELDQVMTYPKSSFNPDFGSASYAYYGNNKTSTVIIEPQLEYSKKLNASNIGVLAGFSWQQSTQDGTFIYGTDYNNDNLLESIGDAATISATNQFSQYKYASLFGRLHYDYKTKYILNASVRRDGSSRFGPGDQFGNFGAIGAGWIISEEQFLKRIKFISYTKLRASYGITGNDQINDYQYLSAYGITGSNYQDVIGLAPARIANANFRWESNKKLEFAIEAGFIKNQILFTAAWYSNKSGNQLIDYPLPYMSGPFGHYVANLPALIENTGFEFDINAAILKKKSFAWSLTGNITIPKNKLLKYPGLAASAFADSYVIGEDISIKRSLHFTGVNTKTGLPEFEDVNQDGVISSPEDNVTVGKTSPYFFGGFGTGVTFHELQVDIFFQFSKQYAQGLATIPGTRSNKFTIALQRWQEKGDVTSIARATVAPGDEYYNLALSDAAFYNASYVRLKNVSISYSLTHLLKKAELSGCRFFCEGQNLLSWHKQANIYDPETANTGVAPYKTIAVGFHLTF